MFDFIAMGTNGCIRSEGNPTRAMIIAISGALVNIILDPVFIFIFDMGVSGVAIATSIARVITTFLVIWHFVFSKKRYLTLSFESMKLDKKIIKSIIIIGSSPFFMMLSTTFVAIFSNRALLSFGGDAALGSLGAIMSVFMLIETFLYGLMMGSQAVVGYNYGAKLKTRVISLMKYAYIYAISISLLGLLIIFIFAEPLISIFSKGDTQFINVGVNGLKIFMAMIPFVGIHMMSVMYFQASGKALNSIILNLSRKAFFYLPALFIMPIFFNLDGVWMATPIADLFSSLLAMTFIFYEYKKYY